MYLCMSYNMLGKDNRILHYKKSNRVTGITMGEGVG